MLFVWTSKMLVAKKWKSKMLGILEYYHFTLLEPIESVKNNQNMQNYQIITEQTSW